MAPAVIAVKIRELRSITEHELGRTVKASNFGPFFRRACYYQNAFYRKMNEIKVVDKLPICKVDSVLFWHRIRPKKRRVLQEMAFR
jgi:hypothetical protein